MHNRAPSTPDEKLITVRSGGNLKNLRFPGLLTLALRIMQVGGQMRTRVLPSHWRPEEEKNCIELKSMSTNIAKSTGSKPCMSLTRNISDR